MIKGVNRQIIELTDMGSIYYEKAWLVVKPEYARIQQSVLDREAQKLLKDISSPSTMKPKRSLRFWAVRLLTSAAFGAGAALLIERLIL